MPYQIQPERKNCIEEREIWKGEGPNFILAKTWRFGYIVVEDEPDLSDYNPEEGADVGMMFDFEDWSFSDGSGEIRFDDDDIPKEQRDSIIQAFNNNGIEGLEELGYESEETEYWFFGPLGVIEI